MRYLRGFTRYRVTVTTRTYGTFTDTFWSRTAAQAITAANRKWRVTNAAILEFQQ